MSGVGNTQKTVIILTIVRAFQNSGKVLMIFTDIKKNLILLKTLNSTEKLSYFQTTYGTAENQHGRSAVQSAGQQAAKRHSPCEAGSISQ